MTVMTRKRKKKKKKKKTKEPHVGLEPETSSKKIKRCHRAPTRSFLTH
jgi:hypothetical protein